MRGWDLNCGENMLRSSLTRIDRIHLARLFRDCPRVDISIDCVLQNQMGRAYIDNASHPRSALIQTGQFCYFGGDPTTSGASSMLKRFPDYTTLMPSSPGWKDAFQSIHEEAVRPLQRYMLDESSLDEAHLCSIIEASPFHDAIKPIDADLADRMLEDGLLLADLSEFESGEDFFERGLGFHVSDERGVAGVAYSSLVSNDAIEISVFVQQEMRQKGLAAALSSQLVLTCIKQCRQPHWDAANLASQQLGVKLGYTPSGEYQSLCLAH